MSLYVNKDSQAVLEATLRANPQSILLAGPAGVGLATVADEYAKDTGKVVRKVLPTKDEVVDLEKGVITIDSIRQLYNETRLSEPKGRVVVIDYAERMAPVAQNAFLKLLEEPSPGTTFILLTHNPERLLPTITSRAQRIDIRPISTEQSNQLLDDLKVTDPTKRSQLLFIAKGLPAELSRLVASDDAFTARADIIRDARSYAQGSPYQKLLLAKKYKDNRNSALTLLEDAMKMLQGELTRSKDERILGRIGRYEQLHRRISEQGNVRLQLSAAVV